MSSVSLASQDVPVTDFGLGMTEDASAYQSGYGALSRTVELQATYRF